MPDDLSHLDKTARRVIDGRSAHYARKKAMHPSTRRVIDEAVAKRKAVAKFEHETGRIAIESPMATNEVDIWKSTAEARVATDLADAQTRRMIAENTLGVVEQQQAETHRQHERELEKQRLANEHEINKMSTIDVAVAAKEGHDLATQRHDSVVARQKGLIKGLLVGASVGIGLGFGAGFGIGLLF